MKFRIEIVMLTQWLKRCVMAQKDKSRGGLWAAILQIRNNRHTWLFAEWQTQGVPCLLLRK